MAVTVGLIGGESTGKSTLAADLADRHGAVVVDERLRAFVDEHGRPPRADEQHAIMRAQQDALDAAVVEDRLVVCDPAPLLVAVYSVVYFDDDSLVEEALQLAADLDLMVWCRPDIPWIGDEGQRDGPEYRDRADTVIATLVGSGRLGALAVTGTREQRLDLVARALTRT